MTKRTITRATAVAVSVGLLAGSAVYEGYAKGPTPDGNSEMRLALASPGSPEDVLVVVNGHEITRREIDQEIDSMLGGQLAKIPEEQVDGIRAQLTRRVTDGVIVKTLLEQAVEKNDVQVDDADVATSMKAIQESLPEGKTVADYAEAIGSSEKEIRREVAMSLRIDKLMEKKMGAEATPTEDQVVQFYEENDPMFQAPERAEVSHILVAVAPEASDEDRAAKRAEAEKIRASLVGEDAADFAAVASSKSDCPSKKDGGDLGTVARSQTVPEFEAAVFSQKPGEIGPVVETPFGFHIVRVESHQAAGKVSLAEVKPFIEEHLSQQNQQAAVEKFIDGLRSSADVVYPTKEAA